MGISHDVVYHRRGEKIFEAERIYLVLRPDYILLYNEKLPSKVIGKYTYYELVRWGRLMN
jgi:hypothetical protein